MIRRLALPAVLVVLAACAVRHRATDPEPSLPSLSETEQSLPDEPRPSAQAPTAVEEHPQPAPPTQPKVQRAVDAAAAPAAPAPRRVWGRVAITTEVVSPSQLMGPQLSYSPEFKPLPVFPEKLVLSVSWGLISVGEATLGVDKIVMFNGRPAYHIVSEARSNSFCDAFYPVRDLNESWLDARTLTSLGYSKKLREGHFFRDEWVLYDRDAGTFVARRTDRDGHFAVRTGTIPAQVQDILSSIYFVRSHDLPAGGEVVVDVNTPDNWPLVVKVTGREKVKVAAGEFSAVLVEPAMRREGLFVQKGKRLRLWLSDDASKRTVMMKVEVFFGHITAVLRQMI